MVWCRGFRLISPLPCWTPLLCRYPCPLDTVRSRTGRALDGFQPLKSATLEPLSLQWWMTTLLTFSQVHFVFIRLLSCGCYAWLSIKGRILDFLKMRWQICLPTSLIWTKPSLIQHQKVFSLSTNPIKNTKANDEWILLTNTMYVVWYKCLI